MHFRFIACMLIPVVSVAAQAIVIRHDKDQNEYKTDQAHPALVDMRHDGHGMLIAPQWVVTAAHTIFYDYKDKTIRVGGVEREIGNVIFHEGYSKPAEGLFQGDAAPGQAYLRANHDIALIKLKKPVTDVAPIALYDAEDETGRVITLYGRGNTGTGITGQMEETRGVLRTAQNTVSKAGKQWLTYRFDQGDAALPQEGFQGNGDSGGPAIIEKDGVQYLGGLMSWAVYEGDLADFKGSMYGMEGSLIRLSYYRDWIADVQAWSAEKLAANHHKITKNR